MIIKKSHFPWILSILPRIKVFFHGIRAINGVLYKFNFFYFEFKHKNKYTLTTTIWFGDTKLRWFWKLTQWLTSLKTILKLQILFLRIAQGIIPLKLIQSIFNGGIVNKHCSLSSILLSLSLSLSINLGSHNKLEIW